MKKPDKRLAVGSVAFLSILISVMGLLRPDPVALIPKSLVTSPAAGTKPLLTMVPSLAVSVSPTLSSSAERAESGTGKPSTAVAPGPPLTAVPLSIAGDCSRDVTKELLTWIASVPDGSTLLFGPKACYRMDGSLRITNRVGLTFQGNGATFKSFEKGPLNSRGQSERRHIWFLNSKRLTLRDIRVEGTNKVSDTSAGFGSYNSKYEFEHAFAFDGVQDLVLENLAADAIWGDGLYLGSLKPVRNARVSGLVIDRNGRQGVGISNADGVLLEDLRILHGRRAGFDMEPLPASAVRNIEIRNSYSNSRLLAFASFGVNDASNVYIHNNTITGTGVPWIYVNASDGSRRHDWRVHNNTLERVLGSPMAALYFVNVHNVDVRGNISHVNRDRNMKAIQFKNSAGALRVIGNDFTGACKAYVKDAATGPVEAADNTLSDCS